MCVSSHKKLKIQFPQRQELKDQFPQRQKELKDQFLQRQKVLKGQFPPKTRRGLNDCFILNLVFRARRDLNSYVPSGPNEY